MTRRTDEARILRGLNDMAAIEDLFAQVNARERVP
jgi:hypothetical protein